MTDDSITIRCRWCDQTISIQQAEIDSDDQFCCGLCYLRWMSPEDVAMVIYDLEIQNMKETK